MACQGCAIAFDEVLRRARRKAPLDTALTLDIAGSALPLRRWTLRITDFRSAALLELLERGSARLAQCAPNAKKIPDPIGGLEGVAARPDLSCGGPRDARAP